MLSMHVTSAKYDRALRAFKASVHLGGEYWYIRASGSGLAHLYVSDSQMSWRSRCRLPTPKLWRATTQVLPDGQLLTGEAPVCAVCLFDAVGGGGA